MAGQKDSTAAGTSATFLNLPSELRNGIYELVLLHDEPIDPWTKYDRHREFTPGLLRVNKVVQREASPMFYGQNRFSLTRDTPEEIALFLEQIGCENAGCIRHIIIDFPKFLHLDLGDITLEEDSVSILASIRNSCANLTTLATSLYSTDAMELRLDNLEHHTVVDEALKLVDNHFRAIPSLQEIVLEVYEDGPSGHIRERMKSHGWTLHTTENVEEEEDWGREFSDLDDVDYGYGYGDEDEDDNYDIDDDSDFWRRAAD